MRLIGLNDRRPFRSTRSIALCEALEGRALLSVAPAGPEVVVNTLTAGEQTQASVATDASGAFVVVWQSGDVHAGEVRARLFDADGRPRGDDFRVDSPGGTARRPAVAADDAGGFIVAWTEADAVPGVDDAVYFRTYDPTGAPRGEPTRAGAGSDPSVAMDSDGDSVLAFVASPASPQQHSTFSVRRFSPDGSPDGTWTLDSSVPGISTGSAGAPRVGCTTGGDFTLACIGSEVVGAANVYSFRFANGAFQGPATKVFSGFIPVPWDVKVSANERGDTVIVVGTSAGMYARVFDAAGTPRSGQIYVAEGEFSSDDGAAAVADDGTFVVTFVRFARFFKGPGKTLARRFDADGKALGDEFVVSDLPRQMSTSASPVAPMPGGGFVSVMAGTSSTPVPGGEDVYARRFSTPTAGTPVDRVYVRGTDWTDEFLTYLDSTGIGSSPFGYAAGGTPDPLPMGWGNLNQVSISFTGDVSVKAEDLRVTGVNRPLYSTSGFAYDEDRHVATWTFDRRLPADRYTFTLDADDVHDAFHLNVVPGDADRSGKTNALDLGAVRARLGGGIGLYVRTMDLNGDRRINALDLGAVKVSLNNTLPAATAATALLHSRQ